MFCSSDKILWFETDYGQIDIFRTLYPAATLTSFDVCQRIIWLLACVLVVHILCHEMVCARMYVFVHVPLFSLKKWSNYRLFLVCSCHRSNFF